MRWHAALSYLSLVAACTAVSVTVLLKARMYGTVGASADVVHIVCTVRGMCSSSGRGRAAGGVLPSPLRSVCTVSKSLTTYVSDIGQPCFITLYDFQEVLPVRWIQSCAADFDPYVAGRPWWVRHVRYPHDTLLRVHSGPRHAGAAPATANGTLTAHDFGLVFTVIIRLCSL